jgi:ABC-type branched-subunit amino acid transport system substrate-binding protein
MVAPAAAGPVPPKGDSGSLVDSASVHRRALLLAALVLAGCGGGDEPEIRPGALRLGVVAAQGEREPLVLRGAQVAAAAVNAFGGIGGAAPIELVYGTTEQLLGRGVRLLILPCDQQAARVAALAAHSGGATAVAPCDDGGLPTLNRVFPTGLPPGAQADALAELVDEPVGLAPPETRRGRLVGRLLAERVRVGNAQPTAGTDAPETVLPPADAPDGALYVTYGFPEPGNELDEFYERYKAMFGRRPPSVVAALAGDALEVLATAVEEAASPDPLVVANEIGRKGLEVGGVLGTIEFDGRSTKPRTPWVALRVESGRYRVVEQG